MSRTLRSIHFMIILFGVPIILLLITSLGEFKVIFLWHIVNTGKNNSQIYNENITLLYIYSHTRLHWTKLELTLLLT